MFWTGEELPRQPAWARIREDGAMAESTHGGRPLSRRVILGLERFRTFLSGAKREEAGRKRLLPKVPLSLLGARAPCPPTRARAFGVHPGGRGARPAASPSPPPAPAGRARGGGLARPRRRARHSGRAGRPGASMMEERAAAAVAAAASSCRPLGSGAGPGPTGAVPVSAPAPGPGPAAKGGGGGGGSPGPTAGPEPLSLPGILHFIQHEWARFEAEKARWEAERAELQVSAPQTPDPRPARPGLTRRRRRRHLGAMAAGTAGGGAGGDRDRPAAGVGGRPRGSRGHRGSWRRAWAQGREGPAAAGGGKGRRDQTRCKWPREGADRWRLLSALGAWRGPGDLSRGCREELLEGLCGVGDAHPRPSRCGLEVERDGLRVGDGASGGLGTDPPRARASGRDRAGIGRGSRGAWDAGVSECLDGGNGKMAV